MHPTTLIKRLLVPLAVLAFTSPARAAVISLAPADFAGATLIDFGPVQTFAPINGQTINGVTFGFTIMGVPSLDAVIDDGPGNTNNIQIANIEGNAAGVLSMVFPSLQTRMGYGFAVSTTGISLADATTVSLFDPANVLVGTLSANGAPDPAFVGGFLGVGSDIPFLRAEVRFAFASPAGRFAFDNLRFSSEPVVPEPATITLLGLGLIMASSRFRRHR